MKIICFFVQINDEVSIYSTYRFYFYDHLSLRSDFPEYKIRSCVYIINQLIIVRVLGAGFAVLRGTFVMSYYYTIITIVLYYVRFTVRIFFPFRFKSVLRVYVK